MTLWAVAIGERVAYQETQKGLERLRSLPLFLLHRQRVVVMADRAVAYRALGALSRRFPEARLVPFPGGPEDGLLVDSATLEEVLASYGVAGRPPAPATPVGTALLAWARGEGPFTLPGGHVEAAADPQLVPAVVAGLARGEVQPARALSLLAALGTEPALDFLAWALDGDDPEFQAKYGRQVQAARAALAYLPDPAVLPLARRLLSSPERAYSPRTLKACTDRALKAGSATALSALAAGHPLERQIRRWAGVDPSS